MKQEINGAGFCGDRGQSSALSHKSFAVLTDEKPW